VLSLFLMPRIRAWEASIGRRLRLRDLFVLLTVVECGSMSKAGLRLGVATPSISEVITDLEHAVGARLLDRSTKGVTPTVFGNALLGRARAAFDELHQGIREIESLADPASGEVRIGCPESTTPLLIHVIERLARRHPRMRFSVRQVQTPTVEFPELHERKVDLVIARLVPSPQGGRSSTDLDSEVLFDDPFWAVVGPGSKWARRRKVDLAELAEEKWIVTPLDALAGVFLSEAFVARGLNPPRAAIESFSIHLRTNLASRGDYVAVLPRSVIELSAARYGLKRLPVVLSSKPSPVGMVTLRNRSLTPAVRLFMETAREVGKTLHAK
jgi:DNA-binding transcriptional LysR family regulator